MNHAHGALEGSHRWRRALAPALIVAFTAGGCAWKQERDQLRAERTQILEDKQKVEQKAQTADAQVQETNATLDEVQASLEDLRSKELKVVKKTIELAQEGTARSGRRESLRNEIRMIRDSIHANLDKLNRMERESKRSKTELASQRKLADELKRTLEEKETMIATLESRVLDLTQKVETQTVALKEKEDTLTERESTISQRTKELHTAYVAVASKDTLKQKGIVEKKGSVAGLGGAWRETGKFDPEVFKEIDYTEQAEVEIPAPAKKVRVLPGHPSDSYEIVASGEKASTLKVTDPQAFWKADKVLIVMTPD